MGPAIRTAGLRKAFGDQQVLNGIDLNVEPGTVFALLGPNGAGKTTTVHILTTLIRSDGGDVLVAGHDPATAPDAVRAAIGVTGQFSAVDNLLTGRENLRLMADLHHLGKAGKARVEELVERFDLGGFAGKRGSQLSGGQRRRLDLAMGLTGRPSIVFLDEPTTGLDPRSRREMWRVIRELVAGGVTIFLTTQYLEEADELADQVAVLDRGVIVGQGTPEELKRLVAAGHVRLRFADAGSLARAEQVFTDATADADALTLQVPGNGGVRELRALLDRLDTAGIEVEDLSVHTPDLDDVFFALTGRSDGAVTSTTTSEKEEEPVR